MRNTVVQIVSIVFFCSFSTLTFSADPLIYNNSTYGSSYYAPGSSTEIVDYGTITPGTISRFKIRYYSPLSNPGTITVRFYDYVSSTYIGYPIKTFYLTGLSGSGAYTKEYIIPEQERFNLVYSNFGYSYEFSNSSTGAVIASDGAGSDTYFWKYDWMWEDFILTYFNNGWGGFYMQVYKPDPNVCTIEGYKFNDLDADGAKDTGESNLSGWNFYLDNNNNGTFDTGEPNSASDPNGMYRFKNLPAPATYRVREVIKAGWTQTLPGSAGSYQHVIAAEPNRVYRPYNFGNVIPVSNASISGSVFYDSNGNSTRDAGESGQTNWQVYIDTNGNCHYNTGEPTALTNASGNYQITGLSTGVYRVAEEMQSGWVQTYPTAACTHSVTISTPGQAVSGIHFGNHTFSTYGGGSGFPAFPYLIYNHLHLQAIGAHKADWNKYFKLMANIDLSKYSGDQFNLIGRYNFADQTTPFSGDFDGNGYTISNFTYNYTLTPQEYIGLFGYVWYGDIKNLRMQNINIRTQGGGVDSGALVGRLYTDSTISDCHISQGSVTVENFGAAGLIGSNQGGTVTDCSVKGLSVTCNTSGAGGIVCENGGDINRCSFEGTVYGQQDVGGVVAHNQGVISRCYANANVNGFQDVGGLVGSNVSDGIIRECYSQGTVQTHTDPQSSLAGNTAGGLAGYHADGEIFNCYSAASVSSTSKVGGLVGVCWGDTTTPDYVTNCYAVGAVSGTSTVGGLIGWNIDNLTVITGSFWDKQTTGRNSSNGGTGLLTAQMKTKQTYLTAGWDFDTVWRMCIDGISYPKFQWPSMTADFACPDGVGIEDFAKLSKCWNSAIDSACSDIDLSGDNIIETEDLILFCDHWLTGR